MASLEDQTRLLDDLQREINHVQERVARLFEAAGKDNRAESAAQASKLKRHLPGSIDRFHATLDQLDDELQLARTVMRRDLALCRERAGVHAPKDVEGSVAAAVPSPQATERLAEEPNSGIPKDAGPDNDVVMQDAEENDPQLPEPPSAPDQDEAKSPEPDIEQPDGDVTIPSGAPDTSKREDRPSEENNPSAKPTKSPSEPPKQEKTPADDDKPPGTATFSNAGDLDSLFNDSTSVGPSESPANFGLDANVSAPFDFESFNAGLGNDNNGDNDSISALLPGLQDYANNNNPDANTAEPDFSSLFAPNVPPGEGSGEGEKNGESTDDVFGDIMNFGDFNANDFAGGGEGGGEDDGNFDFTFD